MEPSLSSPSPERLRCWRLFFESALALGDVLDAELEQAVGIPQRWYDVLVHLEESPGGIRMNELAERILYSKSGFTRVIDRMEEAGLVAACPPRGRPPLDPRRPHRQGHRDDGRGPRLPPRRNRAALLAAPHRRGHQGAHSRAREGECACPPASPWSYPQLNTNPGQCDRSDLHAPGPTCATASAVGGAAVLPDQAAVVLPQVLPM